MCIASQCVVWLCQWMMPCKSLIHFSVSSLSLVRWLPAVSTCCAMSLSHSWRWSLIDLLLWKCKQAVSLSDKELKEKDSGTERIWEANKMQTNGILKIGFICFLPLSLPICHHKRLKWLVNEFGYQPQSGKQAQHVRKAVIPVQKAIPSQDMLPAGAKCAAAR